MAETATSFNIRDETTSTSSATTTDKPDNQQSNNNNNNNNNGSSSNNISEKTESISGAGEKRPANIDSNVTESKKSKIDFSKTDVQTLPTRQYLDSTVVPILLEGLAALAKERPEVPIDFLIDFLEKHKHEHVWKQSFCKQNIPSVLLGLLTSWSWAVCINH